MDEYYNSAWTGEQIDGAVESVRKNADRWNSGVVLTLAEAPPAEMRSNELCLIVAAGRD